MSPPSWTSLSSPTPSHPSRFSWNTGLSSLCQTANSHWLSILHIVCNFSQPPIEQNGYHSPYLTDLKKKKRMHYCFSGYIANWWVKKRLWEKPTLMCFYPHGTVDNSVHIQCLLSYVVPLLLQSHAAWRPAQLMDSAALPSWLLLTGVK